MIRRAALLDYTHAGLPPSTARVAFFGMPHAKAGVDIRCRGCNAFSRDSPGESGFRARLRPRARTDRGALRSRGGSALGLGGGGRRLRSWPLARARGLAA